MRKIKIILLLFLSPWLSVVAQEDYMKTLVEKACQCLSEITEEDELTSVNLGLCIINEAAKYKDELLLDHQINMANIDQEGEALGRLVALEMLTQCPEQLKRMVNARQSEDKVQDQAEDEDVGYSITGQVKSIQKSDFINFSITSQDGKTSKFYWLTFIEGNIDLQQEFESLTGKTVEVNYSEIELYDYNLGEYRTFNIIDSLLVVGQE
ncbi:MAG: hypothetical protein RLZZ241_2039 [Bacteroidota bacterium]|jgi:hypothetical protein